jgi:hypothetical protein
MPAYSESIGSRIKSGCAHHLPLRTTSRVETLSPMPTRQRDEPCETLPITLNAAFYPKISPSYVTIFE